MSWGLYKFAIMNFLSTRCRQKVEQPSKAAYEGSYIGVGSGVESFGHSDKLVLVDDAEAYKLCFGALTGIKLHGERDELENGEHKINCNT